MKLNNNEVKEKKEKKKKRRKISIQKIFNLISFMFILACCIFYGTRFIKLYLENNKKEEVKVLADNIKEGNKGNENFKNVNGDYYFEGTDLNNYLKYSNLTWRIIKVGSDSSVTVVLDNSITSLAAGTSKSYTETYINMWLNKSEKDYSGILEKNLNNPNNYLTYTNTCNDIIDDTKNITCKENITDTMITVPSLNDYVNTGGQKGFMNNEEYYYLTNMNTEGKIWYVDSDGKISTSDGTDIIGIKPVVTIKNTTKLISGDGTKDNPYTIETEHNLFGSYVKLGNDIWRIYNVGEKNVKLSLDSYLTINDSEVKYKYSTTGYYHNDTKSGSLAYYLKNTYLPTLSYQDIIDEVKYSNGVYSNTTNFDYTEVLKTEVDTKVALLSIGDIFLNPTNTNYYTSTGISKDSNLIYVMRNDFKIYTKVDTTNLNVIPVISIDKSLLTKGKGTKENPLEVSHE